MFFQNLRLCKNQKKIKLNLTEVWTLSCKLLHTLGLYKVRFQTSEDSVCQISAINRLNCQFDLKSLLDKTDYPVKTNQEFA